MHGKYSPGLANRSSRHQKTGKSQFLHDSHISDTFVPKA